MVLEEPERPTQPPYFAALTGNLTMPLHTRLETLRKEWETGQAELDQRGG
jgi:hypothetical protein